MLEAAVMDPLSTAFTASVLRPAIAIGCEVTVSTLSEVLLVTETAWPPAASFSAASLGT